MYVWYIYHFLTSFDSCFSTEYQFDCVLFLSITFFIDIV
jgi:hypothetical protein